MQARALSFYFQKLRLKIFFFMPFKKYLIDDTVTDMNFRSNISLCFNMLRTRNVPFSGFCVFKLRTEGKGG